MRIGKKQPNPSVRYGPEMKILIVGGGISGLTLGALLQQRGFIPTIVEKIPEYGDVGYVIVLWPSGSKILKGLNLYRKFEEIGHECTKYDVANEKGETLNIFSNDEVREEYGPIISTYRPEMINLLREAVNPDFIRMNTTVENIRQDKNCVYVTFTDGSQGSYDLVVGCDGIRSRTRQLVFGDVPLRYSGMSGWGFWIKSKFLKVGQISEYWGTGKFFGIWPTKGRLSVFTSIRSPNNVPDPLESRINRIKSNFKEFGGMVPEILENLDNPEEIYSSRNTSAAHQTQRPSPSSESCCRGRLRRPSARRPAVARLRIPAAPRSFFRLVAAGLPAILDRRFGRWPRLRAQKRRGQGPRRRRTSVRFGPRDS